MKCEVNEGGRLFVVLLLDVAHLNSSYNIVAFMGALIRIDIH